MAKKALELVHHKDLHKVQLQGLKVRERSIFMALCYKAMEQDNNLLEFDVNELVKLTNFKKGEENIYAYLRNTYRSLKNITIEIDKQNGYLDFVLFTSFQTFEDTGKVQFRINDEYKYLLNNVVAPYTIQNLLEYNNLSSKYSQLLYSIFRQWDKKKEVVCTIEDFKAKLDIPENYRMSMIDARVFTPIKEELSKFFPNLKIDKIKEGRKITHIKFTWSDKKKKIQQQKSIIDVYAEPQQLSLLQAPKLETVETPKMDLVRQCIADHPDKCPGHEDEALTSLCAKARRFKR